ncbi:AzlD domain-containing protein [Vibrio hannami]|uniref:AzlD domain-containing protein n=1 Tax=Vibrio hannami TaxID=2717094 RepID=UPI0024100A33|nr:AzlD domain-containing protein [Vibrio hannami]MDG3085626.1 AzlD domain-containing protein [Vibrio hannami]
MGDSTWLALAVIAFGTYLMRVAPLYWMSRRIKRREGNSLANIPVWLTVMGPVMIAAMFGTSLVPAELTTITWTATAIGTIATLLTWYKSRTLGLPVLIGVVVYGVVVSFLG